MLGLSAPHASGATLRTWSAKVTGYADGDTIWVRIGTGSPQKVRFAAVQAMEIHAPSTTSDDDCHAKAAMDLTNSLVPIGTHITLSAKYASSTSRGRIMRFITLPDG